MARGVNGCPIYFDDVDRLKFLEQLDRVKIESGAEIIAYCFMGNHFHLAIKVGLVPLSAIMQRLMGGHAQRINTRYGRTGHLFQARYRAKLCLDDSYLRQVIQYIHMNPVRAGLVLSPGNWPWSSFPLHPDYSCDLDRFDPWGATETRVDLLREEDNERPDIEWLAGEMSSLCGVSIEQLKSPSQALKFVEARRRLALNAVAAGHSMTDIAGWLGMSRPSISRYCSGKFATTNGLTLPLPSSKEANVGPIAATRS
jgi:REP element-mobilizing transposase RayT